MGLGVTLEAVAGIEAVVRPVELDADHVPLRLPDRERGLDVKRAEPRVPEAARSAASRTDFAEAGMDAQRRQPVEDAGLPRTGQLRHEPDPLSRPSAHQDDRVEKHAKRQPEGIVAIERRLRRWPIQRFPDTVGAIRRDRPHYGLAVPLLGQAGRWRGQRHQRE